MKARVLLLALVLAATADAAKVGVLVEFPNGGTFIKCVEAEKNADAYKILQESGIPITWVSHQRGHSICSILDTGCLDNACVCRSRHWNFFINRADGGWLISKVGFDGGTSCREHYCAREGDIIGLTFNSRGTPPKNISFQDICPPKEKENKTDLIGMVIAFPQKNAGFISAAFFILLLVGYFIYKPWQYI